MARLAIGILFVSLLLCVIGFAGDRMAWFEVVRVLGVGGMSVSFLLLIVNHVRTPDPGPR